MGIPSDSGAVLVSGATGLVGGRLVPALLASGRAVRVLSRSSAPASGALGGTNRFAWNGRQWPMEALASADAVVHLAGEPVFGGFPTTSRKSRIRESRVASTQAFADAVAALPASVRPRTLVCASAVGYYGDRGDEILDEDAAAGTGFLADVCVDWENAARRAESLGLRVVRVRIGIVLAREGGALPMMALPFRFGAGGPIGTGRQWVPWIHVDDLVQLFGRCIRDEAVDGAVNGVSPEPIRNEVLTQAIARELHRPAFLRAPAFALRLGLGELAGELLGSRRCVPRRAEALGFGFGHTTIETALAAELG